MTRMNVFKKLLFILFCIHYYQFLHAENSNLDCYSSEIIVDETPAYLEALANLERHINETSILSDTELESIQNVINDNIAVLNSDVESVSRSFELIELFETTLGPIFVSNETRNGFNRDFRTDGLNLHRNIMLIKQGLIDYAYNEVFINGGDLLKGKYFKSSEYFPGLVEESLDPDQIETAKIKCSYLLASGSQPWNQIGNPNVIRPTGCYLPPGAIGEITVPIELVDKGIMVRVGAHFWDLSNKGSYKRMDRVSIQYDVNDVTIKIAHPLGGGIYIELPLGTDEGIVEVSLKNVVRSPFLSLKTFDTTSLEDWQSVERNRKAPWTDFETDKFMMQVPTSWIYNFDDPIRILEEWDASMDVVSDLLGRPRVADRHKNYLQFDVIIRGSAYHPGYPMSNTPYNPYGQTNGVPTHNILKGPQYNQDIHFHELGHEVAISKFVGETEALVNFLYVPVLTKIYDFSLGEAFAASFGPSYNFYTTKDNITKTRLVSNTFQEGLERNKCGCTLNEVRYQHRGYAHYVDIVELFGWSALEDFWKSESDAADAGTPFPVNNQDQDDRIFRMSKAAGVDLRPLFHFWGLHPEQPDVLEQMMIDNDLVLPMSIKKKLHQYQKLIPSNKQEFIDHGLELYPNFQNYSGTQFDYGEGWYKAAAEYYDEGTFSKINEHLSDIIILYYGTDCFDVDEFVLPEFEFETDYCLNQSSPTLPSESINNISGVWSSQEIITSMHGTTQYIFTPSLHECACEWSTEITVEEAQVPVILGNQVVCFGESTVLNVDADFETYSWELNGEQIGTASSILIESPGLVNLFVTDLNACESQASYLIEILQPLNLELEFDEIICPGETSSVLFLASGGSEEAYEFSMQGENLMAGNYAVQVTDSEGCTAMESFEILESELRVPTILGEDKLCYGTETNLSVLESFDKYRWEFNGQIISDAPSISFSESGTINLQVTDENNCLSQNSIVVEVLEQLNLTVEVTDATCYGEHGSALFSASGGSGQAFEYSMSGESLAIGTYTVEVGDSEGCTSSQDFEVNAPEALNPTILGDELICFGTAATLYTAQSYTNYSWEVDGEVVSEFGSVNIEQSAEVSLTVLDENACQGENSFQVEMLPLLSLEVETTQALCAGENGSAQFFASGGTGEGYEYSMNGKSLNAGFYTVMVTDSEACTAIEEFEIIAAEGFSPTILGDDLICHATSSTLSVEENYETYLWFLNGESIGNESTLKVQLNGIYTLAVTNENGCESESTFVLTVLEPLVLEVETTQALCAGENGSAQFFASGGSGDGYEYSMSGESLTAGFYTIMLSDGEGCTAVKEFEIQAAEEFAPTILGDPLICNGASTSLSVGEFYENYEWSFNGEVISTATTLQASVSGIYVLNVQNENACEAHQTFTLEVLVPLDLAIEITQPVCANANGSAIFFASGGSGEAYEFSMNGESLTAGIYTVTVTDSEGCTATKEFEIQAAEEFSPTIIGDGLICHGTSTTLTVEELYEAYEWSFNGEIVSTTSTLDASISGMYVLNVINEYACQAQETFYLEVLEPLYLEVEIIQPICTGDIGSALFFSDGGSGQGYEYSINGESLIAGIYTVIVTDSEGCSAVEEFEILATEDFIPTIVGDDIICSGSSTSLSVGENYDSYEWLLNGEFVTTESTFEASAGGLYQLNVVNENGCEAQQNFSLEVLEPLVLSIELFQPNCAGENGSAIFSTEGGSGEGYEYSINGESLSAGLYSVLVTDSEGCTTMEEFELIEAEEFTPTIIGDDTICSGTATSLSVGEEYETYVWSFNEGAIGEESTLSVGQSGIYTLEATDENGCTGQSIFEVAVLDPISVIIDLINPLCAGDPGTAIFSAEGGSGEGYFFSMTGKSLDAGTYEVLVTDNEGCTAFEAFELTEPEAIEIEMIDDEILVSGGTSPYQIMTDTIGTSMTVSVIDSNGCEASTQFIISSNYDIDAYEEIKIYPNPVNRTLHLDLGALNKKVEDLKLFSSNGKYIQKIQMNNSSFDLPKTDSGVYFIQIIFEDGTSSQHKIFIIQ